MADVVNFEHVQNNNNKKKHSEDAIESGRSKDSRMALIQYQWGMNLIETNRIFIDIGQT